MTLTSPRAASPLPTWRTRAAFWWICLSALAVTVFALLPYLTSSLEGLARDDSGLAAHYVGQPAVVRLALYVHMGSAGLALLLSPVQFSARLRARVPRLHRGAGRLVLGSIAISGCAALVLAPVDAAGPAGTAGFGSLAVLWLAFAAAAFRAIRRRDVVAHRRWAVRAFC